MFKKREMILTATTVGLIEQVRLALEVLLGKRICFKHLHFEKDLESGRGAFFVGNQELDLEFDRVRSDFVEIRVRETSYTARFDSPVKVRVIESSWAPNQDWTWWVGTSDQDRWQEPLFD